MSNKTAKVYSFVIVELCGPHQPFFIIKQHTKSVNPLICNMFFNAEFAVFHHPKLKIRKISIKHEAVTNGNLFTF